MRSMVEGKAEAETGAVDRGTVERARSLRRSMSPAEAMLWQQLRRRPGGFQFRRQRPCAGYYLDFFCREAALAIEVDGDGHGLGEQPARDAERDVVVASRGVLTIRVPAGEVFGNLEGVVAMVVEVCRRRAPPPRFARSPSPRKRGEEF
jgi:very-short-patch-repair endonuclease